MVERAGVEKAHVSETIIGQMATAAQGKSLARFAHVNADLLVESATLGFNHACGSGLRAVAHRVTIPSSVIKLSVKVLNCNWEFSSSKHHLPSIWSTGIDMVQVHPVGCPDVFATQALVQHLSNVLWSSLDVFRRLQPAPGVAVLRRAAVTGFVSCRYARAEPALLQVHIRYFALKVDLSQICGALRLVKSEASTARGPSS